MDMKVCSKIVNFYKWIDINKFLNIVFNIKNSKMYKVYYELCKFNYKILSDEYSYLEYLFIL